MADVDSELLALIKGDFIAGGMSRDVYKYLPDTSRVIKCERLDYTFDNVMEWEVWQALMETPYKDWLARCCTISPNGRVSIQERTSRVPTEMLPTMIPSIFRDTKAENWGLVVRDGEELFVCHDYAHVAITNVPAKIRLVKAEWHIPEYKGWDVKEPA
jgi:hypothetical protein